MADTCNGPPAGAVPAPLPLAGEGSARSAQGEGRIPPETALAEIVAEALGLSPLFGLAGTVEGTEQNEIIITGLRGNVFRLIAFSSPLQGRGQGEGESIEQSKESVRDRAAVAMEAFLAGRMATRPREIVEHLRTTAGIGVTRTWVAGQLRRQGWRRNPGSGQDQIWMRRSPDVVDLREAGQ